MAGCQKLDHCFSNILHWKKNQKDSDDFWHRKLTLKVKFWYFLTASHYSNFQNLVISFEYSWFLAKNLSNFVSLPWKLHNRECHSLQSADLWPFYSKINYKIALHYIFFFTFQLSNLFFISLAVADLLLSALVMPFAIVNDLTGEWKFGKDYCNLWISTDVMCCTASITSLLAISLER